jgi:hypothetical protein
LPLFLSMFQIVTCTLHVLLSDQWFMCTKLHDAIFP